MTRIRVTIDHVALRGIDPVERKAILEGLQAELGSLLTDSTTRAHWARSQRVPVVRLGAVPLNPGISGGRQFGSVVARASTARLSDRGRAR